MSPLSDDTTSALDSLREQIQAAERFLKRLPGSRIAAIETENNSVGIVDYLQFSDFDGQESLCVTSFDHEGNQCAMEALTNFPITERIEIAKLIPAFIDAAESAEADIANDAAATAEAIEQAIALRQTLAANNSETAPGTAKRKCLKRFIDELCAYEGELSATGKITTVVTGHSVDHAATELRLQYPSKMLPPKIRRLYQDFFKATQQNRSRQLVEVLLKELIEWATGELR